MQPCDMTGQREAVTHPLGVNSLRFTSENVPDCPSPSGSIRHIFHRKALPSRQGGGSQLIWGNKFSFGGGNYFQFLTPNFLPCALCPKFSLQVAAVA